MDMMGEIVVIRVDYEKTVMLAFLSSFKNIMLIFSLFRSAFLSSYNSVILIFAVVKTALLFFVLVYIKWLKLNIAQATVRL